MPKKFKAPDPNEKRVQYGAEVVRNINRAAASDGILPAALLTFQAFAESPESDPAPVENDQSEPDPQGDSAATDEEN